MSRSADTSMSTRGGVGVTWLTTEHWSYWNCTFTELMGSPKLSKSLISFSCETNTALLLIFGLVYWHSNMFRKYNMSNFAQIQLCIKRAVKKWNKWWNVEHNHKLRVRFGKKTKNLPLTEWLDLSPARTLGLSPPEASLSFSGWELSLMSCSSAELTMRPPIL